jgi:DNA-binding MarR family transcriptional regulator
MTPAEGTSRGRLETEAFVTLVWASDRLQRRFADLFKREALSPNQYHVLRILCGVAADGLSCGEVAERMITRDPDVTRLLDRLERRGLVERWRSADDRRVVRARITDSGMAALARLDTPVTALHAEQFGHMDERQLARLVALVKRAADPLV